MQANAFVTPLIFPGNLQIIPSLRKDLKDRRKPVLVHFFLSFLSSHEIWLISDNYVLFYEICTYLTSNSLMSTYRVKNICILNPEIKIRLAGEWFNKSGNRECISSVCIPSECVATSWRQYKSITLVLIVKGSVICLAGAGIGSLDVVSHQVRQPSSL